MERPTGRERWRDDQAERCRYVIKDLNLKASDLTTKADDLTFRQIP